MQEHLLVAKPAIQTKLDRGEQAFNGLELYVGGPKHLTVTGQVLSDFPGELHDRIEEIAEIAAPFLKDGGDPLEKMDRATKGGRFPSLQITDVINTSGFTESNGQLFGAHPILGSTTGKNLVVNPRMNTYCWMHDGVDAGGDAWVWLAHECGAVPWEKNGKGILDDRKVVEATLKHALVRGLITKEQAGIKEPGPEPVEPEIKEKALAIAVRGDPLKFLIWQAQLNHLGDIEYQKVLICSIASAASRTSHGIQPGGTGDKGSGKSDACIAVYHLVPKDRRLEGSLSPMSLFYLQDKGRLKPGMILFSDDVEYEGIIPIYKRSTGNFQHGATHFTVSSGRNRTSQELVIPPRIVWWLTSVESVANEQAFDRQYPISTDSSPSHKKRVAKEIAARRARRELRLAVDGGILIAREILADIFDNGPFRVVIPQADKVEWLKTADFRGQEQFWDLVDALAILRWRQRETDADGWLVADNQDLIEAKDIMMGHKVAHISDLTEAEVKVVGVLTDGLPHSQKELTEALGIAQSTLSERLRSILSKSAIITEDLEHGKKFYSINPKMNLNSSYWQNLKLVDFEIDSEKTYRLLQIAFSACYRYVIGVPIGIIINNSNRIPSSLSANLGGCIEDRINCDFCEICPLAGKLTIYSPGQNTDNALFGPAVVDSGTDKSPMEALIGTDNANSRASDISIRVYGGAEDSPGREEEKTGLGQSPRKPLAGLQGFKKAMRRRECSLCGKTFNFDLTPWDHDGRRDYACYNCLHGLTPAKPQFTLSEVAT
jgi:hypothetical protein